MHQPHRRQSGVTYLAILFVVALTGVGLAATGVVWKTAQQREKERELLFVGDQFRRAIMLYYEKTPGAQKQYAASLHDLLEDKRFPSPQRHLRKIYIDPMTRSREWGLLYAPNGGIMGVHSLSNNVPIKSGNFSGRDRWFEGKSSYADWKFVYAPNQNMESTIPAQPQVFTMPDGGSNR